MVLQAEAIASGVVNVDPSERGLDACGAFEDLRGLWIAHAEDLAVAHPLDSLEGLAKAVQPWARLGGARHDPRDRIAAQESAKLGFGHPPEIAAEDSPVAERRVALRAERSRSLVSDGFPGRLQG